MVGATGLVGTEMLRLLHERAFPVDELRASGVDSAWAQPTPPPTYGLIFHPQSCSYQTFAISAKVETLAWIAPSV